MNRLKGLLFESDAGDFMVRFAVPERNRWNCVLSTPMALPLWCVASLWLAEISPISRTGLWPWRVEDPMKR